MLKITTMHSVKYAYACTYMLMTSEIKDSNDTKDGREELGLVCHRKTLTLPVKQYSFI